MTELHVPIEIDRPYDTDLLPPDKLRLDYDVRPSFMKQDRFAGRIELWPRLDLNYYRCDVVFDWLEILVDLGRVTDWRTAWTSIRDGAPAGTKAFVYGIERQANATGREFIIRVFDPTRRLVNAILEQLGRHFGRVGRHPHRLVGLELSVDFYVKKPTSLSDDEVVRRRVLMSQLLRQHIVMDGTFGSRGILKAPENWPRVVQETRAGQTQALRLIKPAPSIPRRYVGVDRLHYAAANPPHHQKTALPGTYYIGADKEMAMYRLQDKVGDRHVRGQPRERLDRDGRRSRIELCLRDQPYHEEHETPDEKLVLVRETAGVLEGLGLATIDDLARFDFKELAMAFKFQIPTVAEADDGEPDAEEIEVFRRTGALGLDVYQRGRRQVAIADGDEGESRDGNWMQQKWGLSRSYEPLNEKIRLALKRKAKVQWARET